MRFLLFLLFAVHLCYGQKKVENAAPDRPKLVVGVVVDQMRWDYLYRYYDRYASDGGFKRLLNEGFSCENTFINYIPSYTACGHTTLYTGSVPAVHGITGNEWYDRLLKKRMYCTSDDATQGVGTNGPAGRMSPRNMTVTSICDELKLATNFRSKVIGVAFKDRGGILPAGHSADAAYWYEASSGNWVTSDFYMKALPEWVKAFNARKLPDSYYRGGWNTLYPINTYIQSTTDIKPYEGKPLAGETGFPYKLDKFIGKNYGAIASTPYGNTLTKEMAIAAVNAEKLGTDSITDFLAVSFSTPDYIGHSFGPNSIEVEDNYLRLDRDLGDMFNFLDEKVGKGEYVVFLSADHGVAHVAGFSKENRLPGGHIRPYEETLDSALRKKFGNYDFVEAAENSQIFLNHRLIDSIGADENKITDFAIDFLSKREGIDRVVALKRIGDFPLPDKLRMRAANGYHPMRSGDIQIFNRSGWMGGGPTGTTHGSWNPYDTHIPLVWYGWRIRPGKLNREVYMTDVAPTIAAMLEIQMPSGCVGDVIPEVFAK